LNGLFLWQYHRLSLVTLTKALSMPTQRIVLLTTAFGLAVSLSAQSSLLLYGGPVSVGYEAAVDDPDMTADMQDGWNGWNVGAAFIVPWKNTADAHSGFLLEASAQHRDFTMTDYQGGLGSGADESLLVTTTGAELHLALWWSLSANGRLRFSVGPSFYTLLDSHMGGHRRSWGMYSGGPSGEREVEGPAYDLVANSLAALTAQLHYTAPLGKHLGLDLSIRVSRSFNSMLSGIKGVQVWDICPSAGLRYAFGK
jgi:hypothetical protein